MLGPEGTTELIGAIAFPSDGLAMVSALASIARGAGETEAVRGALWYPIRLLYKSLKTSETLLILTVEWKLALMLLDLDETRVEIGSYQYSFVISFKRVISL